MPGSSDTVTFDGSSGGGTVSLNTATIAIQSLTASAFTGTLDFSANANICTGVTLSATSGFVDAATAAHTINMGAATWTLSAASSSSPWTVTAGANLTLNCNSSTISYSATASAGLRTFAGGSHTYNILSLTGGATIGTPVLITGTNTFASIVCTNLRNLQFTGGVTQTVTGAITFSGTQTAPCFIGTAAPASAATLSVASAITWNWVMVQSITKAGAGSITAFNSFDGGANTSVTVFPPGARVIGG